MLEKRSGGSEGLVLLLNFGGLVLTPDASGAGFHPRPLTVYHHRRAVHIGQPTSIRSPFRMANVVAGATNFAAYLTTRHVLPFDNGVVLG